MPGIGIILNPHSKRYKKAPHRLKRIGFIVGDKGSCTATKDLMDIERVAQEFKERDIDILGMSGGDGTNHRTITTFINVYGDKPLPMITFLRGGTMNTIAGSIGIHGTTEKILSNLLLKYHEDEPFQMRDLRIMKINNYYGFIWGCGVIDKFMHAYYDGGNASPWKAFTTLSRTILSALVNGPFTTKIFERTDAEIESDGGKWPFKNYSAIYVGAVHGFGLDFRVFYLVDKYPDKFHLIGFSSSPRSLLKFLPAMFLGRPCGSQDIIEKPVERVRIRLAEPCGYTIDGDMHPPESSFDISPGPLLKVIIR